MKAILIILAMAFSTVQAVEVECLVKKLVDDNYFDTALQEYLDGDEDYDQVTFLENDRAEKFLEIGGLGMGPKAKDLITIENSLEYALVVVAREYDTQKNRLKADRIKMLVRKLSRTKASPGRLVVSSPGKRTKLIANLACKIRNN